jgi:hypothetical protein
VICTDNNPHEEFDEDFIKKHIAFPLSGRKMATPSFYVVFAKQVAHADEKFQALSELLTVNFDTDGAFYFATPQDVFPYFTLMDGLFYKAKDFESESDRRHLLTRNSVVGEGEGVAKEKTKAEEKED